MTTHLHLVPRLRIGEGVPQFPTRLIDVCRINFNFFWQCRNRILCPSTFQCSSSLV